VLQQQLVEVDDKVLALATGLMKDSRDKLLLPEVSRTIYSNSCANINLFLI